MHCKLYYQRYKCCKVKEHLKIRDREVHLSGEISYMALNNKCVYVQCSATDKFQASATLNVSKLCSKNCCISN